MLLCCVWHLLLLVRFVTVLFQMVHLVFGFVLRVYDCVVFVLCLAVCVDEVLDMVGGVVRCFQYCESL